MDATKHLVIKVEATIDKADVDASVTDTPKFVSFVCSVTNHCLVPEARSNRLDKEQQPN